MFSKSRWIAAIAVRTATLVALPVNAESSATEEQALALEDFEANQAFSSYLFIICGSLVLALLVWRVVLESVKYIRTLTCLNNPTQRYFSAPSQTFAWLKENVLYAPVFRKRHNREFQLSTAVNMGTLPTRLQLLFLMSYFATNVAFCVASIQWNQNFAAITKEIRNRSGILAVINMVPLFIMVTRSNPLIAWLQISYDTFNLLHRWFGRIVALQILVHTFAWIAGQVNQSGWPSVADSFRTDRMIIFGLIATAAVVAICLQSMSVLRHAFYETFKYIHIALVLLTMVGIWYHLHLASLPQVTLLLGMFAIWVLERCMRVAKIIYRNVGKGGSKALVECLPGNAVRVTLDLARPWSFKPGQHAYLYMPSVGLLTSHPFSVAWSEATEDLNEKEDLVSNRQDILALQKTRISFIIRARTGFTNSLFKKVGAAPEGRMYTRCFAEGPYGGHHTMHSYGTVMLFAGGIGISHQVPYVRDLVAGFASGTVATRKIVLVWVIQSPEHLEWIRPWMTEILTMDKRRDILRIMLFVSRPRSTKEIHSPSATVQMFPGRPSVETLLDFEIENQIGAMGVSVCAGGSLSDDVRKAVRSRQQVSNIDFIEEAFSW